MAAAISESPRNEERNSTSAAGGHWPQSITVGRPIDLAVTDRQRLVCHYGGVRFHVETVQLVTGHAAISAVGSFYVAATAHNGFILSLVLEA